MDLTDLTGLQVLWVMPYPPLPARHGGQLRVSNLMKRVLAHGASVEVLHPAAPGGHVPDGAVATTYEARQRVGLRAKLACAASPYPDYVWTALPVDGVPKPQRRPDIVVACQPHQWPIVERLRGGAPVVLDTQNVETDLYRQLAATAPRLQTRSRLGLEMRKSARVEERAVRSSSLVVAVSEHDRAILAAMRPDPVPVVRNGVDLGYFAYRPRTGPVEGRIVMTGTLGYEPNRQAAHWLAAELLPAVRRRHPDVSTTMVGGSPTPDVLALDGRDGIRVFADVPDIRPYTDAADVFVAPLRIGGGTPLKIVEALAQGLPTITTTLIAQAMGIGDDVLYVADDAAAFAERYDALVEDQDDRARRIEVGRRIAEERYDWTSLGREFAALLGSLGR